ncbi:mitochondrial carrier domain-containing protein [Hyaloraphidium curvatum]|nr:mitochondrial carrier domain-containing protein [Hyaloraphidium curvatum]
MDGSASDEPPPGSSRAAPDTRKLFDAIRSGESEGISRSDLERWIRATVRERGQVKADDAVLKSAAERVMREMSEDRGRGALSGDVVPFERFDEIVTRRVSELSELFKSMDLDHDNSVDAKELRTRLATEGFRARDEFVKAFIDHLDENHDRKIQLDELLRFALLIPGASTLTDLSGFVIELWEPNFHLDPVPRHSAFDWRNFVAGGVSGALSRTATAPIDRIRIVLQVSSPKATGSTIASAVKQVYEEAGAMAFFKGNGLNVAKIIPETALLFGLFETSKKMIAKGQGVDDPAKLTPFGKFLAGGLSGVVSQTVMYPVDSLRCRMMANLSHVGPGEATIRGEFVRSFRELSSAGLPAFFRGWLPATLGIFPYSGLNLSAFETLKLRLLRLRGKESLTSWETMAIGSVAGGFAASVTFPLNATRTRLQASNTTLHPHAYEGFLHCVAQTYQRLGIRGFYQGLGVSLMKVLPSNSLAYLFYEATRKLLA